MLSIGNIDLTGDLILAPMDGYSDHPFRSLARTLGSAMSYTEFINCKDVVDGHKFLHQRIFFTDEERPVAYQLLDNEPERFFIAAEKLSEHAPDTYDINLGCSSRSVTHRGAGASLLRDFGKIAHIIGTLSKSVIRPITAKIRLGWDDAQKDYLTLARIIEDSGAKMIAVHARTKKQMFAGHADWEAIADIKRSVSIPVIGNGDIKTVSDIKKMRSLTKCDGIMIGRAAISNPWIFSQREKWEVPTKEVHELIHKHFNSMQNFYSPKIGFLLYRKFVAKFIEDYQVTRDDRRNLLTLLEPEKFIANLDTMIEVQHEKYCSQKKE